MCCCPEECPEKAKTDNLTADRAVGEDYGELEYFSEAVKGQPPEYDNGDYDENEEEEEEIDDEQQGTVLVGLHSVWFIWDRL